MYVDLNGRDFYNLKLAIKEGSEPEYQKYFGKCLGKYLDTNLDCARVLRAIILQEIVDTIGDTPEQRDAAINEHFRRLFLPYLLYRKIVDGDNAHELLEECVDSIAVRYIPSDYDSIFLFGAAAFLYGRRDLLNRLANLDSIRRGTGYYDVETFSNFFKALRQLIDNSTDSLTLERVIDGVKFPSRTRSQRQYEKFHLTHMRIPAFEVIILALISLPTHVTDSIDLVRFTAGVLVERFRALEVDTANISYRLACQIHEFVARTEDFKPFVDTSKTFDSPCGGSPFAYLNYSIYCAGILGGDFPCAKPEEAMAAAKRADESCMYVMAMNMAAVLHSVASLSAEADALIAREKKRGYIVLFILEVNEEEWETMLRDLSGISAPPPEPVKKQAEKAKRTFDWEILLDRYTDGDEFINVDEIKARVRAYTKNGTLTKGKQFSLAELLASLPELEYGPEDFQPLLIAQKMVSSAKDPAFRLECRELLASLCSHPRVIVSHSMTTPSDPDHCLISEYEEGITTKYNADGGLEISIPYEVRMILPSESSSNRAVLKRFDDFHYGIPVFSKSTLAAAKALIPHMDYGRPVTIPQESVKTALPTIEKAASAALFSGAVATPDTAFDYPKIDVCPKTHVRISVPDPDMPVVSVNVMAAVGGVTLALRPGKGERRIMFRPGGKQTIFVRDIEAEAANAAPVYKLIDSVGGGGQPDDSTWVLNGGVAALLDLLEGLKALGDTVDIDWSQKDWQPNLSKVKSVRLGAKRNRADHWLGISGEVSLDDGKVMEFEELIHALAKGSGKYIRLSDGQFLKVTEKLRRQLELIHSMGEFKNGELNVNDAMLPALENSIENGEIPGEGGGNGDENGSPDGEQTSLVLPELLKQRISDIRTELGRDVDLPAGLNATLRQYQKEGYQWLSHLAGCGIGACLADDMGLGKTVQIITLLLERGENGPSLVVAPTSVCPNWVAEIRKFAPSLRPLLLDSQNETETVVSAAGPYDVVVASYGMCYFRNDTIASKEWECVVLDEAQAIKNHVAKRTKAVKNIRGAVRIAATGTPVENRLTEFWSIFDFLNPGMLFSVEKFARRYVVNGMASPALKKLVSPLVLRRLKTEVLDDLPEKTEVNISVKLGKEESEAYEAFRRLAMEKLEHGSDPDSPGRKFEILSELTKLRRFCCHPSLLLPDMKESSKMEALKDILEELHEGGHKALVFSQFVDYLSLVRDMIAQNGWKCFYLDGSTPQKQRSELVEKFQNEEADFFLISLKAGGFGLNLTAANYVILLDPWWNPAVENQAADRIHRIGQKLPVTVYRLIAENTIEERVVALHGEKLKIADDLLGDAGSASLTEGDLLNLIR